MAESNRDSTFALSEATQSTRLRGCPSRKLIRLCFQAHARMVKKLSLTLKAPLIGAFPTSQQEISIG